MCIYSISLTHTHIYIKFYLSICLFIYLLIYLFTYLLPFLSILFIYCVTKKDGCRHQNVAIHPQDMDQPNAEMSKRARHRYFDSCFRRLSAEESGNCQAASEFICRACRSGNHQLVPRGAPSCGSNLLKVRLLFFCYNH